MLEPGWRSFPARLGRAPARFFFCYPVCLMTRRKKSKFKVAKEAKRRARTGIDLPPPERVILEKRNKSPKHKKTLSDLLEEEK